MSLSQLSTGYKVSFVGDSNVGKTSIITRLCTSVFDPLTAPTVGVSNTQVPITVDEHKVWLNIWDTAGQERFRSLVPVYTHGACCVVIVFDISQRSTFDHLDEWLRKVRDETDDQTPIVICANKHDLELQVTVQECKKWTTEMGCELFVTSAATGEHIMDMFNAIARIVREPKYVPTVSNDDLNSKSGSRCC